MGLVVTLEIFSKKLLYFAQIRQSQQLCLLRLFLFSVYKFCKNSSVTLDIFKLLLLHLQIDSFRSKPFGCLDNNFSSAFL